MFEYEIPIGIKTELTKEFVIDFLSMLTNIFDLKQPMFFECLINFEGTHGWVMAFKYACQKHNMEDVFAYYNQLEWYDSDLFDDEFASLIVEYSLVKQ